MKGLILEYPPLMYLGLQSKIENGSFYVFLIRWYAVRVSVRVMVRGVRILQKYQN